ncbi:CvpA family protein [Candidatus Uhrbacteria bacterium]|nr:CvpA family protein [Candidatus Uhrbacteria bacterium]
MLIVDIILVVVILSFAARGWKDGAVESLGGLIGTVIAFLGARYVSNYFGLPFGLLFPGREGIGRLIAFILIFVLIYRLVGWLFTLAAKLLKVVTSLPVVSLVDGIIGAACGFLSGVVLVGSSVYLVMSFRLDPTLMDWLSRSTVAGWSRLTFENVLRFLL